jgi:DNA polymerase-3 subunit delta
MEKLASFANGSRIEVSAVEALVSRAKDHSNFEIWDAIIRRDRPRSIVLMHRLLDDGADPVMMVGVLAGLFRRMLLAKDLLNKGARQDEIAKATGQYGPRGSAFNNRIKVTSREEILQGLLRIGEVDNAIKNSEGSPRLQIEYLVAELTLPGPGAWSIVR